MLQCHPPRLHRAVFLKFPLPFMTSSITHESPVANWMNVELRDKDEKHRCLVRLTAGNHERKEKENITPRDLVAVYDVLSQNIGALKALFMQKTRSEPMLAVAGPGTYREHVSSTHNTCFTEMREHEETRAWFGGVDLATLAEKDPAIKQLMHALRLVMERRMENAIAGNGVRADSLATPSLPVAPAEAIVSA